jgi:aminodeoxyfutalosine deaminase
MAALPSPNFLRVMPKVELHVHIEGSIRPETVLKLAERHGVALPADTVEGLAAWYQFRDFDHFVEVYLAVTQCVRTPEDVELVFREFLTGQKEQNVLHTEATYTASTIEKYCGIPWDEQFDALSRARDWAEEELGVTLGVILDIVRGHPVDRAMDVLGWAKDAQGQGVVALGLAGVERLGTEVYLPVFEAAAQEGVPTVCHAGETAGPEIVWQVIELARTRRIGHGVRSMEDPSLVAHLRETQIPLEVCPTSNVCIGVYPTLADHPLRKMIDAGLNVTINSDDPPMFGTSINEEWRRTVQCFGIEKGEVRSLTMNAVEAALVDEARRERLRREVETVFNALAV